MIFKGKFKTKSAGLYNEHPVSRQELLWPDIIIVMEDRQRSEIARRFPDIYLKKHILSLDIPDIYSYGHPQLIHLLKSKLTKLDTR